jgi:YidC/Oxa1 family membrane protein insertase
MFAFLNVPVAGAYHVLIPVLLFLQPILGPAALAVTIILFTGTVRLCLLPLARAAVRGERARAVLAPKIAKLRARHKHNPQLLQQEMARLQQESGVSMFAGCLPMLAQAPFFTVMYRLFTMPKFGADSNALLANTVFGIPANTHISAVLSNPTVPTVAAYVVLFALLAAVATFAVRWQSRQQVPDAAKPPAATLMRLLPYGTLIMAAILPLAGGCYLLTTTTWTAVERALLRRTPATPPATRPERP